MAVRVNRQIVLKSRPLGVPQPAHFEQLSVRVPPPSSGEFLVENLFLSVDRAQRGTCVPPPQGPRIHRDILTRRLGMEGFVIFDHPARFDEVAAKLAALLATGRLRIREDIETELEAAPAALVDVYAGRNTGKKLIHLRD